MKSIHVIQGSFGPFEPYVPVAVPLWLAISLRKKDKCRIIIPDWMSVGTKTLTKNYE